MMFSDQVAQLLIVRGPNGEVRISVLNIDGDPRIEFRVDPSSATPDAIIRLDNDDETLLLETSYMRMVLGSTANPNAAWRLHKLGSGQGITLDNATDTLRAIGDVGTGAPEQWENITSFSNGWTAGVPTPQYYLDPTGQVHLRGRLIPGVTANGTVMCTLPVANRPPQTYFEPVTQDQAPYNQPAVEVQTDGDLTIWSWTAGNMVLDAVKFHTF